MSVNKVILVGNVGKDPEVRYLDGNGAQGTGTKVATFTLATSERYRDRNGELRENTEWHNLVCWRQSADVAEKYIHKGTQIYVEGKLRTRSWTDAQGVKKYQTEINVDTLQLLGRRPDDGGNGGYGASQGGYDAPRGSYGAAQGAGYGAQGYGSAQGNGYGAASQGAGYGAGAAQGGNAFGAGAGAAQGGNAFGAGAGAAQGGNAFGASQPATPEPVNFAAEPTDDLPF